MKFIVADNDIPMRGCPAIQFRDLRIDADDTLAKLVHRSQTGIPKHIPLDQQIFDRTRLKL